MEEHGRHCKSLEVRRRQRYCVSRCVSRRLLSTLPDRRVISALPVQDRCQARRSLPTSRFVDSFRVAAELPTMREPGSIVPWARSNQDCRTGLIAAAAEDRVVPADLTFVQVQRPKESDRAVARLNFKGHRLAHDEAAGGKPSRRNRPRTEAGRTERSCSGDPKARQPPHALRMGRDWPVMSANRKLNLGDYFRFARDSLVTRQSGQRDCNYLTLIRYM